MPQRKGKRGTQCLRKVQYLTIAEASRALRWLRKKYDDPTLEVYRCPHCSAYHLGHSVKPGRL